MRKIKKGDDVIVLTGKDKGKRGNVLTVRDDDRVVVQNINMIKRHTKGNPNRGSAGGIIEREAPIHISNIALFNPAKGKGDRVGIKVLENGKKVRQFKSNGEVVDI
jgi:large subunit ribosomal protein L24